MCGMLPSMATWLSYGGGADSRGVRVGGGAGDGTAARGRRRVVVLPDDDDDDDGFASTTLKLPAGRCKLNEGLLEVMALPGNREASEGGVDVVGTNREGSVEGGADDERRRRRRRSARIDDPVVDGDGKLIRKLVQ